MPSQISRNINSTAMGKELDKLPISAYKNIFLKLLNESQSVLVVGETGSGKTTQIPQWCMEYCRLNAQSAFVACTQPRRIAAMSVAARVAKERNDTLGNDVGYVVRFESCRSDKTRLLYMTDGMLLREAMFMKNLSRYGIIILDEAHERTLQTDILFGVLKRALNTRNSSVAGSVGIPLKLVIMSATMQTELFQEFFNAPILRVEGRCHPVANLVSELPQTDMLTAVLTCVFQIHRNCDEGDILVFCAGQDEILSLVILTKKVIRHANIKAGSNRTMMELVPLPLYASLPVSQQMLVFERHLTNSKTNGTPFDCQDLSIRNSDEAESSDESPPRPGKKSESTYKVSHRHATNNFRRVIYATNVAETSVTIPGIKYVVDTGKFKCRTYCPKSGLESLKVTSISKAQALQRSGRAGRVEPGLCYRLYTAEEYERLSDHPVPEIKRCSLESVILQLIAIDSENVGKFQFLERPEDERMRVALRNLLNLKAIKPSQVDARDSTDGKSTTTNGTKNLTNSPPLNSASKALLMRSSPSNIATPKLTSSIDDDSLLQLSYDLTSHGKKLIQFPLNPSIARIIIAAHELGCLDEALTVVSALSVENIFHIQPNKETQADLILNKFYSNEGDMIMLLNVFRAFRRVSLTNRKGRKQWCIDHYIHIKNLKLARLIRKQLVQIARSAFGPQLSSCGQDTSVLRRALTYGLFNNVATMWDGKYKAKGLAKEIFIHPSSCLFRSRPECVLYVEIVETNKCYMRNCSLIDSSWIREVSNHSANS